MSEHKSCVLHRSVLTACFPGGLRKSLFYKQMEPDAEFQTWPGPQNAVGLVPPFLRMLDFSDCPNPGTLIGLAVTFYADPSGA